MPDWVDYAAVFLLGALVGTAELASRYRDAPHSALYTRPAVLYVALNVAASLLALQVVHVYGWSFTPAGSSGAGSGRLTQILVAGVGAMAVFRTSLFTVRAGDRDIGVGPGSFLQIFRDAADREVDRVRAEARGKRVGQLMDGIDYRKASDGLVPYCLALMQNVSDEEQQKLERSVDLLDKDETDAAVKVRILGLHLMNVVGPDVLTAAVDALRDQMKPGPPPE